MLRVLYFLSYLLTCSVFANFSTEEQISRMEEMIEKTNHEIKELQIEQKRNIHSLEDTKRILRKNSPSKYVLQISSQPSLFDLDYTRYPASKYPNYFKYASIDGSNQLEFHGWLQLDQDIFFDAQGLLLNSGASNVPIYKKNTIDRLWIRRLRPTIEGTVANYFNFLINPDIGGKGQFQLFDAFIDINYFRILGLQSGLQMSLLSGIENYFENFDYLARSYTMEMSNTAMLAPDRQFGFVLHGSLGPSGQEPYFRGLSYLGFDDMFSYQLGIVSGSADNTATSLNPLLTNFSAVDVTTVANKAVEGRVFYNPFINQPKNIFQHLGIGFAASSERAHLETALPYLNSIGQNAIFYYENPPSVTVTISNGQRTRIHPQMVWGIDNIGILADFGQTLQTLEGAIDVTRLEELNINDSGPVQKIIQKNHANQIQLIYNLTKEEFNLFHLTPNRNFNPLEKGAIGAWQLVLRYTGLSIDPNSFSKYFDVVADTGNLVRFYYFSDPRFSVQSSNSWSIGINWFWNTNIRFTTEYAESNFKGGCSIDALNAPINPGCLTAPLNGFGYRATNKVIDRPPERIFMQRFQLTF